MQPTPQYEVKAWQWVVTVLVILAIVVMMVMVFTNDQKIPPPSWSTSVTYSP